MKERPILFSGPMVRAILDGRKTQTRRVVKWKYGENGTPACPIESVDLFADIVQGLAENLSGDPVPFCEAKCPFGVPGDRLWVRETARVVNVTTGDKPWYAIEYEAGGPDLVRKGKMPGRWFPSRAHGGDGSRLWCPSIHMPRWASRITLEVVSVRVERLADISEADAKAEGYDDTRDSAGGCFELTTARENFLGAPWAVSVGPNPWVWVVEFRRIEP